MDESYYRDLMRETNRKRKTAGMEPFTWLEYRARIKAILEGQRKDFQEYDETGEKEAEEME